VNGVGEQVTPVVVLKATWWEAVSLFVNRTVSAVDADVVAGTKADLVIETSTVAASETPAVSGSARHVPRMSFFHIVSSFPGVIARARDAQACSTAW
jgi:hypothetical protein